MKIEGRLQARFIQCSAKECDNAVHARGLCRKHYQNARYRQNAQYRANRQKNGRMYHWAKNQSGEH